MHILDRFVPELERYLLIEDIGCFLIAEGLLSNDDYLTLVRCTSKKEAVIELVQLIKSKGPDCIQSFLHALQRSCTETSTPYQGHLHLWELLQANRSGAHTLKKKKSISLYILDRFVPELGRYLSIEDISCYLIDEGLLSNDEYFLITRCSSKKEAVVELVQLIKSKEPDCMQSFLHALQRSYTETSTPHQGHLHLWELLQASVSGAHPLKTRKSKYSLSLVRRRKNVQKVRLI